MSQMLDRTSPEAVGIPSAAILAFLDAAERLGESLHSFMLLRHGQIAAAGWWHPYSPERPHMLFSLSKSFTATAIGLAVAEGRLSLDDHVIDFFPEDAPSRVSKKLAAMRVRHLLSMSTGHAEDTIERLLRRRDGNWVRAFFSEPVKYEPGTFFCYNSGASYMLSAIVQRVVGMPIVQYLQPRLFDPLGIAPPTWDTCPRGINAGGWGLSLKTEDIARFGQLYLQKGMWDGQRILPEEWVNAATSFQADNSMRDQPDWRQGYGFQLWLCRHGAYRGDGAFGQFCIVMPAQRAVLAITSGVRNMQAVLNLVWDYLLPAMEPTSLPENPAAYAALQTRLESLALPIPQGSPTSPLVEHISGRSFVLERNAAQLKSVRLDFKDDGGTLLLRDRVGLHRIACKTGTWQESTITLELDATRTLRSQPAPKTVLASGAWRDENTYETILCFVETPFHPTLTFRFNEDTCYLDFVPNAGWNENLDIHFIGHRAG